MATPNCRHENVEFIGIQKTVAGLPELHLFNCKRCQTTVARWGGVAGDLPKTGHPVPTN